MKDGKACFQFKTSFSPCTVMQIMRYDLVALQNDLNTAISRAPNFFIGSPVIIDLELVKTVGALDFVQIKNLLQTHGMVPVGVRGGDTAQQEAAATSGLPALALGKSAPAEEPAIVKSVHTDSTHQALELPSVERLKIESKIVTTPVRSGMQVYAKGGDLVVIAPVSAGAELLADGHIHVYGPLRGRAMAGVQGNTQARIFCQQLAAELVSIAGYYLVKDELTVLPLGKAGVQVFLKDDIVCVKAI